LVTTSHPVDGGFLFRVVFTGLYNPDDGTFQPFGGISLGYSF